MNFVSSNYGLFSNNTRYSLAVLLKGNFRIPTSNQQPEFSVRNTGSFITVANTCVDFNIPVLLHWFPINTRFAVVQMEWSDYGISLTKFSRNYCYYNMFVSSLRNWLRHKSKFISAFPLYMYIIVSYHTNLLELSQRIQNVERDMIWYGFSCRWDLLNPINTYSFPTLRHIWG